MCREEYIEGGGGPDLEIVTLESLSNPSVLLDITDLCNILPLMFPICVSEEGSR